MEKKILVAMMLVILAPLSLIGCEQGTGAQVDGGFMKGSAEVNMITLEDGTKCAVLIGHRRGALDCNWK
jgi:uncharacterized lipoprotein NlpE involved in copper resistance|tara:strand:+ start:248 stop:454 length:207 start_codon:yes stop_codon:yes gene_type:complete